MSFVILGLILFVISFILRRKFKHAHNHGGEEGMTFILIASVVLILFYGIFSRINIV